MKTIINVFKNLKTIDSKPKRIVIGLSTGVYILEIVLNVVFLLTCFFASGLFNTDIGILTSIIISKGGVYIAPFLVSVVFFYPYLGIVSIIVSLCSYFVFRLNICKLASLKTYISIIISVFINPVFYSFVFCVYLAIADPVPF